MSEVESERCIEQLQHALEALERALQVLLGTSIVLEHPHLDDLPFKDVAPSLVVRGAGGGGEAPRERAELVEALRLVADESKYTHQHLSRDVDLNTAELSSIRDQSRGVFHEAHRLLGSLDLDDLESTRAEAERFLASVKQTRSLWLTTPLEWVCACPFVDPLIGFRYR